MALCTTPTSGRDAVPCTARHPGCGSDRCAGYARDRICSGRRGGGGHALDWATPGVVGQSLGPDGSHCRRVGVRDWWRHWAFSRSEEGAKRFGQIVIGAAIAIGAANIVTSLAFVGAVL